MIWHRWVKWRAITDELLMLKSQRRRPSLHHASENSGLREQRAGLQQQTLDVDLEGVEHGEKVLRAEQGVCQSESQRGRDETSAVLHHPGPGAPLDRRGLACAVYDGVTCGGCHSDVFALFIQNRHSCKNIKFWVTGVEYVTLGRPLLPLPEGARYDGVRNLGPVAT